MLIEILKNIYLEHVFQGIIHALPKSQLILKHFIYVYILQVSLEQDSEYYRYTYLIHKIRTALGHGRCFAQFVLAAECRLQRKI